MGIGLEAELNAKAAFGWDLHFPDQRQILSLLGPEFVGKSKELVGGIHGKHIRYESVYVLPTRENGNTVILAANWRFVPPGLGQIHALPLPQASAPKQRSKDEYYVTRLINGSAIALRERDASTVWLLPNFCSRPSVGISIGDLVRVTAAHMEGHRRVASSWSFEPQGDDVGEVIEVVRYNAVSDLATGIYWDISILFHPRQRHGNQRVIRVGDKIRAIIEKGSESYRAVSWQLL